MSKAPTPTSGNDEVEATPEELAAALENRGAPSPSALDLEAAALLRKQAAQIDDLQRRLDAEGIRFDGRAAVLLAQIAELQSDIGENGVLSINDRIAELRTKAQIQYGELIGGDDRRDAERYRWLRDEGDVSVRDVFGHCEQINSGLDAAIDAAIAKEVGK